MDTQTLTEHDRAEYNRFCEYLRDCHNGMTPLEQIDKYGADYLGYTADEIVQLKAAQKEQ